MKQQLEAIKNTAVAAIGECDTPTQIDEIRVKYLGKKGELTALLKQMGQLDPAERPVMGQLVNEAKAQLEALIADRTAIIKKNETALKLKEETIDITMPGKVAKTGKLHPLNTVLNDMIDIFQSMGFDVVDGPEVETDHYNFEALNVPADHPARDMQDTFYLGENLLLRTQTSAAQIRTMENRKPPIRIICPGRVFRADEVDATHSPVFHQIEGLVVDKGVTMCDLKGVLEQFAHEIYGKDTKVKFRPSFFPFTEPSVEVDVSCSECGGKGCRVCKGSGWIEILGAGMVHPKVLSACGIDPEVYSGFAFGIGLDRLTTTRYKISDIRLLFENDKRFLDQF
ncbi:MAG: phenylalanine--tRNA ligase subunit alpha [Ruminococcaceae bacterium]|nr:phenylalanine--tRNA ligase subunit alpha [Oscillospiraceae bacterium]MEE1198784.1 phenylalanine--tRNA ligase subunit alpha [Acutalibacteraceae bacterium]